tara:strand:+ start:257 stop:850 length:594 start_codon:yes stop_codon:yes gene_type:complete
MATLNLTPSGILVTTTGWTTSGGTTDEVLADADDATLVYTANQSESVIMGLTDFNPSKAAASITSIRFFIRGVLQNTRSGDTDVRILLLNSSNTTLYSEDINIVFNAGYVGADYYGTARTGPPLSATWNESSLNGLRLSISTAPEDPPGSSEVSFMRAHVEVTYVEAGDPTYPSDDNLILKKGNLILKKGLTTIGLK